MIRRLVRDTRGAAAVEIAVVLPIMIILLMGVGEIGQASLQKQRMQAAVNAGVELALQSAENANDTGGSALAAMIAPFVRDHGIGHNGTATVVVNNGPVAVAPAAGGAAMSSGNASGAAQCYCPGGTTASLNWGAPISCGTSCQLGGTAGRFVVVSLAQSRSPIFPAWPEVAGLTALRVSAMVRVK